MSDTNLKTSKDLDLDLFSGKHTAGKVSFNNTSANDFLSTEAYKALRTNILFLGTDIKTILLTSHQENEGKSTTSTELAKSLAEIDKKVLLVDADLRKSVMQPKSTQGKTFFGLSEILSNQCSADEAIYSTQHENFDVLFSGNFPPNPVELLGSKRFGALINSLKDCYDYIIIDSPPLGYVIDAAVIASVCDGAIFVISEGVVSIREAQKAKLQIEKSGCKMLGVVLNDVQMKHKALYAKYKKRGYGYYGTTTYEE